MIFVTGDLHGDIKRFNELKKVKIKKGDTLLVCGDFGFVWDGSKSESRILKWIGKRDYNVAFVDGFNDNLELLEQYPTCEWNGGTARCVSGSLVMLMRGEIYELEGKRIFAFGGGVSVDKEQEGMAQAAKLPSEEEQDNALKKLAALGNKVDYIITHDAPAKVKLFIDMESNQVDNLHAFLDAVSKNVSFKRWFIGKYHMNKPIPPCYHLLFTNIAQLD